MVSQKQTDRSKEGSLKLKYKYEGNVTVIWSFGHAVIKVIILVFDSLMKKEEKSIRFPGTSQYCP